jgi:hypothetical protein
VSGFDLALPDWDFTPEKHEYEAPPRYTERQTGNHVTEEEIQAEANRRTGDVAIYRYYVSSVGWIPTIIFVVSITIFIFGISFPSKRPRLDGVKCILILSLQQYGLSFGLSTTKRTQTNALDTTLASTRCLGVSPSSSLESAAGM